MPCKHCSERGLSCGAKTWGQRRELRRSISSPPATTHSKTLPPLSTTIVNSTPVLVNATTQPTVTTTTIVLSPAESPGEVHATTTSDDNNDRDDLDLVLTSRPRILDMSAVDATYLAYYQNILFIPFIEERNRGDGNIFRRFSDLSSPVVKYATLLYAASFKDLGDTNNSIIAGYMDHYFKAANDAFRRHAFAELVYACYAMCNHAFISELPFDNTAQHAKGFLSSFKKLTESTTLSVEEQFLMKCMCKDIFCWLTGTIGAERNSNISPSQERLLSESKAEQLYELAERSIPLFQAELDLDAPYWMYISHTYMKAQMITYRLQIYTNFLLVKLRSHRTFNFPIWLESFSAAVQEIGVIMSLNPQLRSLVDHSQLFKVNGITASAERRHDSTEWQLWQPAVMAHYKVQFRSQELAQDPQSVEAGMNVCRFIPWSQTMFRMNSLSALRSLFLACLSISEIHSPESISPHLTGVDSSPQENKGRIVKGV